MKKTSAWRLSGLLWSSGLSPAAADSFGKPAHAVNPCLGTGGEKFSKGVGTYSASVTGVDDGGEKLECRR